MFEAAELGHEISRREYDAVVPELRRHLIEAQVALKQAGLPVVIIVAGVDGAGKGEIVHRLNEWLDPRGLETHAFWRASEEDEERPYYWRFWRALPERGRISILFGAWYADPLTAHVRGEINIAECDQALKRAAFFERMLVEDGALLIKLWLHLSKKAQHLRLNSLRKKPETHWQLLPADWKRQKLYKRFIRAAERVIRLTDSGHARWHLIDCSDSRYRDVTVARVLLESFQRQLHKKQTERVRQIESPPPVPATQHAVTILDHVRLDCSLSTRQYHQKLAKYQGKLHQLAWEANQKRISSLLVFEGWDASGKGSCIRRATEAIDARLFRIIAVAAPTDEERAHHYLWRFWRHLPRRGLIGIFDRSWYGRVLVERVEGFARPDEWMAAYREINDFEEQLAEANILVVKFWLHISKGEQLRRFRRRQNIPYKRYKISEEDWRNRKKWSAYKAAINDMVARTSTEFAPWTIIAGEDKKFARVQVLRVLCQRLEAAL